MESPPNVAKLLIFLLSIGTGGQNNLVMDSLVTKEIRSLTASNLRAFSEFFSLFHRNLVMPLCFSQNFTCNTVLQSLILMSCDNYFVLFMIFDSSFENFKLSINMNLYIKVPLY